MYHICIKRAEIVSAAPVEKWCTVSPIFVSYAQKSFGVLSCSFMHNGLILRLHSISF